MTTALHIKNVVLTCAVFGLFSGGMSVNSFAAPTQPRPGHPAIALVYSGKGACGEGCASAAARVFKKIGLKIVYVTAKTLTPELLESASVYVQPGGDAIEVAQAYRPEQMNWIRNAIADGLGYVGFCAGGFFTDQTVDDADSIQGLGVLPGTSYDFIKDDQARILPMRWKGRERNIFFQGGAYFVLNHPGNVEQLASYSDGKAAAIQFHYGHGRISVSGVHPEAPIEWLRDDDGNSLMDPDGLDHDLADAMGRWALRKRH